MSLMGDPIAIVILPPGVKAEDVIIDVVYESNDPRKRTEAILEQFNLTNHRLAVKEKKWGLTGATVALVVETQ